MGQRQLIEKPHPRLAPRARLYVVLRPAPPTPPPPLNREHPPDACQWCGQEPTTFTADGLGWCLAHTPPEASC
jgi:hypothetical protein